MIVPYIRPARRPALRDYTFDSIKDVGELHYIIAKAIDFYLTECKGPGGLRYAHLNNVMGVLACAQQEVYRRIGAPLEDAALARNGEVYSVVGE